VVILGVDPGSIRTGYGAIETDGRRHRLIEMGVLAPPARASLAERLHALHQGVSGVIRRLGPDLLAVEDLFHAVNVRSALVLGHVRGVVAAFPPATVKAHVTGYGRAEKAQVALVVSRLLALGRDEPPGDATDALAVALCGAHITLAPIAQATRRVAARRG
jgi:crossover junction endodeoxyribonuclease RuvC